MIRAVVLDTGPLGWLTSQASAPRTIAAIRWVDEIVGHGCRVVVPSIADYEVRRELKRAEKAAGLARLDAFNAAEPGRYLPLSDAALQTASTLWALARSRGRPTGDPKELDCDVLIAAQALDLGLDPSEFVVATLNIGHLSLFVPADKCTNIRLENES